jgi:hypothetical protein
MIRCLIALLLFVGVAFSQEVPCAKISSRLAKEGSSAVASRYIELPPAERRILANIIAGTVTTASGLKSLGGDERNKIQALINRGVFGSTFDFTPYLTNLSGWWKLEEASGTRDDAHSTNDLTDNNTVTSAVGIQGTAGLFTKANTEYLSIADNAPLSMSGSFSICAWVYIVGNPTASQMIASKFDNVGDIEYELIYQGGGGVERFQFDFYAGGGYRQVRANSFGAASLNTWYFVVGVFDGTDVKISVNGNAFEAASASGNNPTDGVGPFQIGARAGSVSFDGRIDEVAVWKDRALTIEEVEDLYNSGAGRTYL